MRIRTLRRFVISIAALMLSCQFAPRTARAEPLADGTDIRTLPVYEQTFTDVYGTEARLSDFAGKRLLIFITTADTAADARDWGAALDRTLPTGSERGVVLRIVHLRSVPRLFRAIARRRVRAGPEKGENLFLDWNGDMAKAFGIDPEQLHLILIDPRSQLAGIFVGPVDDTKLERYLAVRNRTATQAE